MKVSNKALKLTAITSGILTLVGIAIPLIVMLIEYILNRTVINSSSIGIIGGADGPTAVYIATVNPIFKYCFTGICFIISVISTTILIIKKKNSTDK